MADGAGTPYSSDEGYPPPWVEERRRARIHQDAEMERQRAEGPDPRMNDGTTPPDYTFHIFQAWNGMHHWTLTDKKRNRIAVSQFGFVVPAGAFQDVELEMQQRNLSNVKISDEIGRGLGS